MKRAFGILGLLAISNIAVLQASELTKSERKELALDKYCSYRNFKKPQLHTTERIQSILDTIGYKRVSRIVTNSQLKCNAALNFGSLHRGHILIVNEKKFNDLSPEEQEFVVAHEVGHGHYFDQTQKCIPGPFEEKRADLYAAQVLGTAEGGIKLFQYTGYLAPLWRLYDRAQSYLMPDDFIYIFGYYGLKTHPTDLERVNYLREWQNKFGSQSSKESAPIDRTSEIRKRRIKRGLLVGCLAGATYLGAKALLSSK